MVEAEVGEFVLDSGPNRQPVKLPKERLNMVALPALQDQPGGTVLDSLQSVYDVLGTTRKERVAVV